MKKLIFSTIIFLLSKSLLAQNTSDSILVLRDTINIHGRVIDQSGNPVVDAQVFSEDFDKRHNYIQTKSNKEGKFYLNGINPINVIRVRKDDINMEERLNSSRYLLITMVPLSKHEFNRNKDEITISAKKQSIKNKYEYKVKDKIINSSFHPFGHYLPAIYPGGITMLYSLIKKSIIYPQKAIEKNIEGLVAVEFTVDRYGNSADFTILKDIGYGCAEQIITLIKNAKKWNPAFNGLNVSQRIYIEIPFKLID